MTPDQFAVTHYNKFGVNEGRAAPPGALTQATEPAATTTNYTQAQVNDLVKQAARQAGGTLSYEDVVAGGRNLNIPQSMMDVALYAGVSGGIITGAPAYSDRYEVRTEQGNSWGMSEDGTPLTFPDTIRYFDKTTGKEISALEHRLGTGNYSATDRLTAQILGQGTTGQWSGQGFGSAEANAAAMASRLTSAGITDLKDFGRVPDYRPVHEVGRAYNGQQIFQVSDEHGVYSAIRVPDGGTDEGGYATFKYVAVPPNAKTDPLYGYADEAEYTVPVNQSLVKNINGQLAVESGTTYGNKKTGQALPAEYDRAGGNIWGGTFAGKGSTGYGVQFADDGTPYFYTAYGGSTNTLNQIMQDLGPIGNIAFAIATGGLSIPQQIAAQAAFSLAQGNDIKDVVKNIAVSTILQGIPGSDFIKEGAGFLNTIDTSGILSNAFKGAATSAAKAALTNQDISDAIVSGAVGGGRAVTSKVLVGDVVNA
jgi:hypothetical protein